MSEALKGFFTTGPDDALSVVDVYKKNVAEEVFERGGKQLGIEGTPFEELASNTTVQNAAELLDKVVEMGSDQGCVKKVTSDRVSQAMGDNAQVNLNNLCGNTAKSLVEAIKNLDLTNLGSIRDVTGKAIMVAKGVEATEVQRIVDLAKDFTKDTAISKIQDMAARAGLRHTLIDEGIRLGIADLLPSLLANKDEVNLNSVLDSAKSAVERGDWRVLSSLARSMGSDYILARYPEAISVVLQNFEIPNGLLSSEYPTLLSEFEGSLTDIDPNWATYTRNGETIYSLDNFSYASKDAFTILFLNPALRVPLMICDKYKYREHQYNARLFYPRIAI
jgi:nitrogen regulatory protein PII-like uncharacterized protein